MTNAQSLDAEQTLDQAFGEYLLAQERSAPVPTEVLVRRYPDVADRLRLCIAAMHEVQRMAGPTGAEQSRVAASLGTAQHRTVVDTTLDAEVAHETDALDSPLPAGEILGRYRIERLLGRGAMGAVYLAYDEQLDRRVALKTPRFLGGHAHELMQRFYREARAAATLRSSNICPVYDVGQIGGVHYISMAYIEGRTLAEVTRERALTDPRQIAELVRKLAMALHKAHQQGIVHRDLKSGNVLLDAEGEPILTDFGLARRIDDPAHLTQRGTLVGSPAYMSPEQIDGTPENVGPASDIYSLGVILYELLTGRLPFRGSILSILGQIPRDEPPPPSQLATGLQPGAPLETVCLRMMAKSPADRYASMLQVAAALLPLTRDPDAVLPVGAKASPSAASRKGPRGLRPAVTAAGGLGLLGVLAAIVFVVTNQGRVEIRSEVDDVQIAVEQNGSAVVAVDLQTGTQVRWLPTGSYELKAVGNVNGVHVDTAGFRMTRGGKVIVHVTRTNEGPGAAETGGPRNLPPGTPAADVSAMVGTKPYWMTRVLFSRDGRSAISASTEVYVWDLASGKLTRKFGPQRGDIWGLALSPDGQSLLVSGREFVGLWDLATGELRREFTGHTGLVWAVAFAPDGKRFASAGDDSRIRIGDLATGQASGEIPTAGVKTRSLAFSPDGKYLASGHFTEMEPGAAVDVIRVWDAETLQPVRTFDGPKWNVCSVAFSPDGKTLVSSSLEPEASIRTWEVPSGRPLRAFAGHAGAEYAVFSPDGRFVVSCGHEATELNAQSDCSIRVWDAVAGNEVQRFAGHLAGPLCVAVAPDGRTVLSCGKDSAVRLWRLSSPLGAATAAQATLVIAGHDAPVGGVAFSPDGKCVASGNSAGAILIHDVQTGRQLRDFHGHRWCVAGLTFSADGQQLLSASWDRTIRLWEVDGGKEVRQYLGHTGLVHAAVWSPDGRSIASCTHEGNGGAIWLWDAQTGQVLRKFDSVTFQPFRVVYSPDGTQLLSGAHDGLMRLWDASQGTVVRVFRAHQDWVISVAFAPDGRTAASASKDGTVRLWDVATGEERKRLTGHADLVGAVAISPDGQRILTGSLDRTMRLWNAATGEELQRFEGHTAEVTRVAFSPTTPQAVSVSADKTIRLWPLPGRESP